MKTISLYPHIVNHSIIFLLLRYNTLHPYNNHYTPGYSMTQRISHSFLSQNKLTVRFTHMIPTFQDDLQCQTTLGKASQIRHKTFPTVTHNTFPFQPLDTFPRPTIMELITDGKDCFVPYHILHATSCTV